MKRPRRAPAQMGESVFRDMLRRVDIAVTIDELRALRRFALGRLENDERFATLDEAIERRAMAMIAEADASAKEQRTGSA